MAARLDLVRAGVVRLTWQVTPVESHSGSRMLAVPDGGLDARGKLTVDVFDAAGKALGTAAIFRPAVYVAKDGDDIIRDAAMGIVREAPAPTATEPMTDARIAALLAVPGVREALANYTATPAKRGRPAKATV